MNDDLLAKYLAGEAGPGERLRVEEWLRQDEEHLRYYRGFEAIWDESGAMAAGGAADEQAAWERFKKRVSQAKGGSPRPEAPAEAETPVKPESDYRQIRGERRRQTGGTAGRRSWLRVAATLTLLLSAGWLGWYLLRGMNGSGMKVLVSGDTVKEVRLSDGSVVTLNKNSRLSYPRGFGDGDRLVTLSGEAFFEVAHRDNQAFIINVNDLKVRVTGTSFNVKGRDGSTEVIVETGSVSVSSGEGEVALRPGEKVSSLAGGKLSKEQTGSALYKYYRTNKFVCQATPLRELADVLSEAYGVNIVVPDETLQQLPITTVFDDQSLDSILEVIGETFDISIQHEEKQIVLKR